MDGSFHKNTEGEALGVAGRESTRHCLRELYESIANKGSTEKG